MMSEPDRVPEPSTEPEPEVNRAARGRSSGRPPRRQSRLAGEHPAYPAAVSPDPHPGPEPEPKTSPAAATPPPQREASSPGRSVSPSLPAPRRRRVVRVQLNTRIEQGLSERLQGFVAAHDAAVQDVVETALAEYLDAREQDAH